MLLTSRIAVPRHLPPVVAALVAATILSPSASAAPRQTTYEVTFEAEMVERWRFDERQSKDCGADDGVGRCDRHAVGQGSARIALRTPRPQRVSVTTGIGGMQPMIVSSIDRGIPLKGSHRRGGTFTDTYSGAWDAANPDHVAAANGCGVHTVTTDVSLSWSGRNALRPMLLIDDLPDCPAGPYDGFSYDGSPAVGEVPASVSERKFGRVKQFRFTGTKAWRGTVDPIDRTTPDDTYVRSGASEIRWSWEATFRIVKPAQHRRGR
ncbi:hypothetical protein VSS74_22075 [Conexibacter stalactiti]|uniref:Spondin domain-containing protein n=1 Tax=Conexibacter stalactiti TaxID=1940611 RepID=A0ABU4HWK1_9ACTN|nr:hypothetical protein [Conexibacter stalactiti]MDW5597052.1 hypothetical protein [Conexibacter stalactiti]MEC5037694.1 hypothetical protein [Conexibacter stalactiti]